MNFDYNNFISDLSSLGERQFTQEHKARDLIIDVLSENNQKYTLHEYTVDIPRYTSWQLMLDGVEVPSLPCGLKSGMIPAKDTIISSLISSQKNLYDANINFNPRCPVISKSNHYHAPALAINRSQIDSLLRAQHIHAEMSVQKEKHLSTNIVVGNTTNPQLLVVSHYDSINTGAVDNSSGVALSLELILKYPEMLETCCFAICGNEEISFDEPVYWGHGYRVLENDYPHLIEGPKRILVVDSFGYSDLEVIKDKETLMLGFPIKNIDHHVEKITMLSGNYAQLMEFYHAENDTPDLIQEEYFSQARDYVLRAVHTTVAK